MYRSTDAVERKEVALCLVLNLIDFFLDNLSYLSRPLLESPRYTSCEFATVECRRFAVGMLMIYVIVSEILLLPVSWLPSWILDTR